MKYIKNRCWSCGGSIEFPKHGIGEHVECPHCGDEIVLERPAASIKNVLILLIAALLICGEVSAYFINSYDKKHPAESSSFLILKDITPTPQQAEIVAPAQPNWTPPPTDPIVSRPTPKTFTPADFEDSSLGFVPDKAKDESDANSLAIQRKLDAINDTLQDQADEQKQQDEWNRFYKIQDTPSSLYFTSPSIYGSSTTIGDETFHNYYSSDGQSFNGSTILIGNTAFTTMYGN